MELLKEEQKLFSGSADTLFLGTFRKGSVTLTLTNQRLIVGYLISKDEYLLEDITSVERFKAMFMNIGLRFHMKNGKTLELATRHVKKYEEILKGLGKM